MEFSDEQLYACGAEGGDVAGLVRWDPKAGLITWHMPGGRERAYEVEEVVEDSEERFAFTDRRGRKFTLFPLDVDYYNDHIRRINRPRYQSYQAMLAAYRASLA